MPTAVVTGAAGFIGSHTCDQLLRAGFGVSGVDNFRTGRVNNLESARANPAFHFIEADVNDALALDQVVAAAKPSVIVHLAALVSVQESLHDPDLNFRLNVVGTQTVAEVARRHRIQRVVFASSAAVYGDVSALPISEDGPARPIGPYGAAKLASEAIFLGHGAAYGFTVRCQRYFNVYGPRQDPRSPYSGVISIFADRLRAGGALTIFGDGLQSRDFISVHDVARANVVAATSPALRSGVANICTGQATSLNKLVSLLRGLAPGAPAPRYAPAKAGDIRHSRGLPDRAKEELDFTAAISMEIGLGELLARENYATRLPAAAA